MTDPVEDQSAVVAFLCDPRSYGQRSATVERVETHASIVFLVGDHAYKLKKAVAFGYMDFSTLEKRQANCETELALNRRTAPELYLRVLAVTCERDGSLALGGAGKPVEWLLQMRRFDQDALLDRLAASGQLDDSLLKRLADAVFAFHAKADPRPEFGGAGRFQRIIESNDRELRGLAASLGSLSEVEKLRDLSLSAVGRHAALIDRRRTGGHVRRCHGDLHLGNVCRIEGRPVLFDALEFDEDLASIDVLYDLAFLLMDLGRRDLRAGANLVFNRYATWLGPQELEAFCEALALLPLYLATRAAVRAHVSARTAAASTRRARDFLNLAVRFLSPAVPRLVAIGGLSGSGKSTVAASLAASLGPAPGALILRSDGLRKAEFGVEPEQRLPDAAYAPDVSDRIYRRMIACGASALSAGHSVILDAVFARPEERDAVTRLAATAKVPLRAFWLDVPRDIMHARLQKRRGDISDATPAVLDRQLGYEIGRIDWELIDASGTVEETADRVGYVLGGARRIDPDSGSAER